MKIKKICIVFFVFLMSVYNVVDSAEIPNLKDSKDFNFDLVKNSTVKILIRNGGLCNGVILDAYNVLTAAHCFLSDSSRLQDFALIYDGNYRFGKLYKIYGLNDLAIITINPEYTKDSKYILKKDMLPLITLDTPFDKSKFVKIAKVPVTIGNTVGIVGYTLNTIIMDSGKVIADIVPSIVGTGGDAFLSHITIWYGMSGCGLFNTSGELVGIGVMLQGGTTIAVNLQAVQDFVKVIPGGIGKL
jgi:hypothetical protein